LHLELASALKALDASDPQFAGRFVDLLLEAGQRSGASDLHLQPTADGLELRWRLDGVLQPVGVFSRGTISSVIARLKVLAELLTYREDIPQEGRIRWPQAAGELRVSTFPTLHGERAVVRLFGGARTYRDLAQLGLPNEVLDRLRQLLAETSGAVLLAGPAGSGKTTTLYACLHELTRGMGRSIVTLEDPIEMALPGVAQSQVNPAAGFDLAVGLRSVLRQDPEVIMIGEIRDRATAQVALEASLTGQLVLSSFHSGSAAEGIGRLLDMGIEPYVVRSGLLAMIFQRLVRKLCTCSRPAGDESEWLGLPARHARVAVGCSECANSGYRGRTVLAEMLVLGDYPALGPAIVAREAVGTLDQIAVEGGMTDRWQRAVALVETGETSPAEIRRVLGFSRIPPK